MTTDTAVRVTRNVIHEKGGRSTDLVKIRFYEGLMLA